MTLTSRIHIGRLLKDTCTDAIAAKISATAKNYIAAPDAFNGTRAHYEMFRCSIELYVKAIPTDMNMILATLSFLTLNCQELARVWQRRLQPGEKEEDDHY
ncbi:hypothetical protein AURDEDRAFT_161083 [Auricularia subglabra TFB-10046 SS5]|nr:hypothetical protein AURDEDRAFT_161083 [Auricularia subglabra TFB-10046 SS5]